MAVREGGISRERQGQLTNVYVPFQIAVHYSEEDLEKEVDGIN